VNVQAAESITCFSWTTESAEQSELLIRQQTNKRLNSHIIYSKRTIYLRNLCPVLMPMSYVKYNYLMEKFKTWD